MGEEKGGEQVTKQERETIRHRRIGAATSPDLWPIQHEVGRLLDELDAKDAEIESLKAVRQKAAQEWLHADNARMMLIEERDELAAANRRAEESIAILCARGARAEGEAYAANQRAEAAESALARMAQAKAAECPPSGILQEWQPWNGK